MKILLKMCMLFILNLILTSCIGYNLTKKSWSTAFEEMHTDVAQKYPFVEWKQLNMDSLGQVTGDKIKKAEQQQNAKSYFTALHSYTDNFCDQHVFLVSKKDNPIEAEYNGSFGLGLLLLQDGRYIVHYLAPEGAAEAAGIKWGAKILRWNGVDIDNAVQHMQPCWIERPPATNESRLLAKCRFLVRASVGKEIQVTFANPDEQEQTKRLTAIADDFDDFQQSNVVTAQPPKIFKNPVSFEILSSGIGYIQIKRFMPSLIHLHPYKTFKKAIRMMAEKNIDGIVLDLRGNEGGIDAIIPKIYGHFVQQPDFYEYVAYYHAESDSFQIHPDETLTVDPRLPFYSGKIVVLVDAGTASTAEGLPMLCKRLENATVMGYTGTAGSFAVGSMPEIYKLPGDYIFGFVPGQSLDKQHRIQVDSNASRNGGIQPDVKIPYTLENARNEFLNNEDVVLRTAIEHLQHQN